MSTPVKKPRRVVKKVVFAETTPLSPQTPQTSQILPDQSLQSTVPIPAPIKHHVYGPGFRVSKITGPDPDW